VANGAATQSAIREAVLAVGRGAAAGLVTLPIAKSVLKASGFPYPGHTEYLAALAGEIWPGQVWTAVMMLAAPELRVVPATVHIPLSAVPAALSPDRLERTIRITAAALRTDFGLSTPRIAVAGLNPHAGEQGTMGREDDEIIRPVVTALAAEGLAITGPHPADTLFHPAARTRYDAVVAMYHDQALIPIKTIAFDHAVNVTLGLPFVRTSPDHGTAFDIAGRNLADPSSFFAALRLADAMAGRRRAAR
jgi:4-hydroxythreonine-4-phosphate dehydrogenase